MLPNANQTFLRPTTDGYAIEALNSKLRRAVRTRGHFPNDDTAMKLLYLVLNHAAEEWKRPPAQNSGQSRAYQQYQRLQSRMMSGAKCRPLNAALMPFALSAAIGDRLAPTLAVCNEAHRLLNDLDAVMNACCDAWNALANKPERIWSLTAYPYLKQVSA